MTKAKESRRCGEGREISRVKWNGIKEMRDPRGWWERAMWLKRKNMTREILSGMSKVAEKKGDDRGDF
ncbi:MAG: hypothetical protein L0170_09220 [Acidobacteria bacterium]|nr:hypothetical protein [Acidobacteriota bacterium]